MLRYEILNGVFRKKLAELAAKLCRKSFVGCQHQSGTVCVCNYICHGKGLARARHTHKGLKALTCLNTGAELIYCLRLISRGSIRRMKLKSVQCGSSFLLIT